MVLYANQNPQNLQIYLMQKEVESKKQVLQSYINGSKDSAAQPT